MNNYIEEANVTMSENCHSELVSYNYASEIIQRAVWSIQDLDVLKKTLFYGRKLTDAMSEEQENYSKESFVTNGNNIAIVHGIIGIATEAGELLEALLDSMDKREPIDLVNIHEELGDVMWYQAIMLKVLNKTFEDCQNVNIAKLRKRYGNKFSEYDANNRNLEAEREILNEGMNPS